MARRDDEDWMGQLAAQDAYEQQAAQDAFAAFAARTQRSVMPEGGRTEAPGQILAPVVHALGEPIRKGQGLLQTMRDYSANEFPETMGAIAQTTDYDPRREAAGYAAGTALNLVGTPGGAGGLGSGVRLPRAVSKAPDTAAGGAPAILSRLKGPTSDDIAAIKEAAVGYGRKGWPDATREVFKTTPEAYAETTKLVPQVSIKDRLPGPLAGEKLPNKGRADPIVSNTDAIAERIAQRLAPWVEQGDPRLKFYHTAPVIRGLEKNAGMSVPEANAFMRDWAGQGAATSPRTQTPPNLRNSSYLMYERARGEPLTPERYKREGNIPGFPMMGMHVDLADKFARGTEKAWSNPKPTTFRENWSGNLRDVTGDTHNIRSTLYEMDQVKPGSLPRGWFTTDDAFKKYKKEGFASIDAGDIVDTLGTKTVDKVSRQSEYLPMTAPWYGAAEKLGVAPAEVQSGGWFNYGGITGLQSPPKTITNLLNDQVDATARAIHQSPEKVVEWWARGKIPLAGVGGAAALTPEILGSIAAQDDYRQ